MDALGFGFFYRFFVVMIQRMESCLLYTSGRPVGLDTLAAAIGEDSGTIEDVYEPYLIQNGLIQRTPRGRVVTRSAYEHFHLPIPEDR